MGTNKELSDVAIADPLSTPVGIEVDQHPELAWLKRAVESLMKPEDVGKTPLIASPATDPRNIIDAVASHDCEVCKQKVWMSPSSLRLDLSKIFILCAKCLETTLTKTKAKPWHER